MKPVLFEIFGLKVYGYGTMIAVGIISAITLINYRAKKLNYDEDSIYNMEILAVIFGVFGGKLLYIITEIKNIIDNPSLLKDFGNGFVVYGSIIGGALVVFLYCRKKGWKVLKIFDLVIPAVALAQGFGRIGCFLAGCCYGRPTDCFLGVEFHDSSFAPSNIALHPTQVYSSIFDFLLAFLLLWYSKKDRKDGRVFALYMILYSGGRFLVEFLRNDPRGNVGILTTSQFIGIFIIIFGILLYNCDKLLSEK